MNNDFLMPIATIASILPQTIETIGFGGLELAILFYGIIGSVTVHPLLITAIGALTGWLHPKWTVLRGFLIGLACGALSTLITWTGLIIWFSAIPDASLNYPIIAAILASLLAGWIAPILFILIRPPRSRRC